MDPSASTPTAHDHAHGHAHGHAEHNLTVPGGPPAKRRSVSPTRVVPLPPSVAAAPHATPHGTLSAASDGDIVLHLLVVGFHHTKGNYVEFIYPSLDLEHVNKCWADIPFVALPDGVHAFESDYVFMMTMALPSDPCAMLYGVSCYQQVKADAKLKLADAAVTRSTVQKAVVALCRYPLFGAIHHRLQAATASYFLQMDFSDKDVLRGIHASLNTSLTIAPIRKEFASYMTMGLDVRTLLTRFGRNVIVMLKLLLLGKKVVFHSLPVHTGCVTLLSLASLIPGGLTHLSRDLLRAVGLEVPTPDHCAPDAPPEDGPDWNRLGFPLLVWSNSELVQQEWSRVSGKRAHQKMLLIPMASLNHLDEMKGAEGFAAVTSNELFLSLRPDQVNAVARVATGALELRLPGLDKMAPITTADKRFIDNVLAIVRDPARDDSHYEGSDGWIRDQFRVYLGGLLGTVAKVPMAFESNFSAPLKVTPEAAEYGDAFVQEWVMTSGSFARWLHRADHLYVSMGAQALLVHPSGPPSDALDELSDSFTASMADLAVARERAREKFNAFFNSNAASTASARADSVSASAPTLPVTPAGGAAAAEPKAAAEGPSALDDLAHKARRWWSTLGVNTAAAAPTTASAGEGSGTGSAKTSPREKK